VKISNIYFLIPKFWQVHETWIRIMNHSSHLVLGNCDIPAEQKISLTNEMKWNQIWPRPKGWVQKIFWTLPSNLSVCLKCLNKHCHKFCPFCRAWTKVSKLLQIFNDIIFKPVLPNLGEIFQSFTELNKKL